jgi:hypothetical protein
VFKADEKNPVESLHAMWSVQTMPLIIVNSQHIAGIAALRYMRRFMMLSRFLPIFMIECHDVLSFLVSN